MVAAALREDLAGRLGRPLPVRRTFPGEELVGRRYRPPFDDFWNRHHALEGRLPGGGSVPAFWRVLAADFVELDQGTGLVHEAPAFGEVDHDLHRKTVSGYENAGEIPLPCAVGADGRFTAEVPWLEGQWVKEADKAIVRRLREEGRLLHHETIRHEYPFCWRSDEDPLIQYARPAWFIRTTARKDAALANSGAVNWLPEHIKEGRFGDFLRNNVDWALSRERFWGTPLNIWINDETGRLEAPASVAEIEAKNPDAFAAFRKARAERPDLDPDLLVHKPWVDEVTWTNPGEPGVYRRVPEVIDCWFDSGAMPFAQWGFPHRNRDRFEKAFPADYIVEAVDQTRGWFYSLLMISTLLFDEDTCGRLGLPAPDGSHPYRSCLVLGHVTDPEGRKESKSRGNYTPPEETLAEAGADAFRWFFLAGAAPWANKRHSLQNVRAAAREFPLKLRNVYSFFTIYAEIDGFDPRTDRGRPVPERPALDRWILSHLEETTAGVTAGLEEIRAYDAARSLAAFAESLSNWWLRRSRRRFWEAGRGADKLDAYRTLYDALVRLSQLAAPFVPFLAEEIHRNLVAGPYGDEAPESVHLTDWPEREFPLDAGLNEEMAAVREIASLGLRVRKEHEIRVRQPLAGASVAVAEEGLRARLDRHRDLIADELNVREVRFREDPEADLEFVVKPNFRRLGPPARPPDAGGPAGDLRARRPRGPGCARRRIAGARAAGRRDRGHRRRGPRDRVAPPGRTRDCREPAGDRGPRHGADSRTSRRRPLPGTPQPGAELPEGPRPALRGADSRRARRGGGDGSLLAVVREREAHFLNETLAVELVAGELPGAERREIEVEGETATLCWRLSPDELEHPLLGRRLPGRRRRCGHRDPEAGRAAGDHLARGRASRSAGVPDGGDPGGDGPGPHGSRPRGSQLLAEPRDHGTARVPRDADGPHRAHPMHPEEILVCSGGLEGIRHAFNALINPGDPVLVEDPTYMVALQVCRELAGVPVGVASDDAGMIPEALDDTVRRLAREGRPPGVLYVGPSFQNPTGRTWSLGRRREVLEVAERHDLAVVEDHAYGELRYEGEWLPSLKSLAPERVIFVHTFSKIFGPGLRLGWVAADRDFIERLGLLKLGTDQCSGALVQRLALAYGTAGGLDAQVERAQDLYRRKRDAMIDALADFPCRTPWLRPDGGFFLWSEVGCDTEKLLLRSIERHGVAFVAGNCFFADPNSPVARVSLRLSYSYVAEDLIPEAIGRLGEALRETVGS